MTVGRWPCWFAAFDIFLLRLLTAAYGTTRLCPDVCDHGEYRRVSGLTADVIRQDF